MVTHGTLLQGFSNFFRRDPNFLGRRVVRDPHSLLVCYTVQLVRRRFRLHGSFWTLFALPQACANDLPMSRRRKCCCADN